MTQFDDPPEPLKALDREALERVRRLGSGQAGEAEIEATKQWGRQSSDHAEALWQASLLWDRLGPAGENLLRRSGAALGRIEAAPRAVNRRAVLAGAAATATVAYLAVRPPLDLWPSINDVMADYRTATGETREISIAGDIQLSLNTATSIKLQKPADLTDRIELLRGEAVVTVGSQPGRELIVVAGDGEARARRAQFDVLHERDTTCVTCLQGEVEVRRGNAASVLRVGQQIRYGTNGLGAAITTDIAEASAWREGLLIFHQRPLAEVVTEINRYRPGRVMLVNAQLGRRVVNGRFRVDNIDGIMAMFEQIFGAKLTRLPGGIVLLG
ncbi:hypothetical protein I8G32_01372 [Rhodopseudomonas palustris]|uniref:FecR domain-containing protein n=1 Tax=Rhodopseudomonas palustris (strain ATCC BAA-98 / CGA009) TaxID=258594 RepID=Q6NA46_RHOPA|nr:FecR domain-containing protein [Rhodopseudomonas palustris]OPF91407.1 iron dicitrate transport regulator FecR [Rhodopseudomonas palustris]QQM02837.1 hypothetical protein I8G32_01372 [Rhodopseudomonas palustris]RJF60436.1 DUF4974 domain-containing protein [Rhodopseudomonas palustris]WAB79013.1 FecR domain-containing protein [Rhodopseudomonas palustris]WCL91475.1 FecR domain-containing protein [Rhodopseudomonas palustris CGA009]